ncbi:hypothetical protein NONI108955_25390 [Nocardia ninae]
MTTHRRRPTPSLQPKPLTLKRIRRQIDALRGGQSMVPVDGNSGQMHSRERGHHAPRPVHVPTEGMEHRGRDCGAVTDGLEVCGEQGVRADLKEVAVAVGDHPFDGDAELYGLADVSEPVPGGCGGASDRVSGHRRIPRDCRVHVLWLDMGEVVVEHVLDGVHVVRVGCVSHRQEPCEGSAVLELGGEGLERFGRAGQHDSPCTVDRGDGYVIVVEVVDGCDDVLDRCRDQQHPAVTRSERQDR